jgi:hypothetical protein
MTYVPEIAAGFGITAATLIAYTGWIVTRTRALEARLEATLDDGERPSP